MSGQLMQERREWQGGRRTALAGEWEGWVRKFNISTWYPVYCGRGLVVDELLALRGGEECARVDRQT